ncbi:MAG: hypothetical protein U9R15_14255 [Chloroflexota bacterium]|nr:hypothetical protein [Chloroflexota bacterium]
MTKILVKLVTGWREALRELTWTLIDCWQCADVGNHLAAWWDVASDKVEVD